MRLPILTFDDPDALAGAKLDRAIARRCSIGDIPTRAARAYGSRTALVDYSGEMTYERLEREANRFAHGLRALGIASREPVAIMAPNCNAYLVAYFGIAKMGGAATLVNMLGGDAHIGHALRATGARVVVCHSAALPMLQLVAHTLPALEHILVIHADPGAGLGSVSGARMHSWRAFLNGVAGLVADPAVDVDEPPRVAIADRQVAQCMFSSGSTGTPKGVLTSHLAVTVAALSNSSIVALHRAEDQPATTIVLPLFHTVGMNVLAIPFLMHGARIHLLAGFDPAQLCRVLAESRSTHFVGLPIMLEAILNHSLTTGERFEHLATLAYGMAPLPEKLYRALRERFPGIAPLLASGMTEALPATLAQWPGMCETKKDSWGVVGAHTDCRVMGPGTADELPAGEQGELVYRGPSVMEGYLGAGDADAVFAGGWLHSGDIGHFDDDGAFWFIDRMKDLVKSGGENVSSVVTERIVLDHPAVAEAAVIGVADESWGERVVAVVVPAGGVPDDEGERGRIAADIISFARERLTPSHRPREIRLVDALPRTGSGKVRKNVLRDSGAGAAAADAAAAGADEGAGAAEAAG